MGCFVDIILNNYSFSLKYDNFEYLSYQRHQGTHNCFPFSFLLFAGHCLWIPVMEFWWRLHWVAKPEWITSFFCFCHVNTMTHSDSHLSSKLLDPLLPAWQLSPFRSYFSNSGMSLPDYIVRLWLMLRPTEISYSWIFWRCRCWLCERKDSDYVSYFFSLLLQ